MDNKWPQPESFAIPNRLCFDKKYVCAAVGVLINLFCRGKIEKVLPFLIVHSPSIHLVQERKQE